MTAPNPFDQQKPIEGVKNVILVGSGKGGVGKSTVAVNLALALKQQGQKVGLLDADIYGPSLPRMIGALTEKPTLNSQQKLHPVERYGLKTMSMGYLVEENAAIVWRGPMLFKAIDQMLRDVLWGELDVLVVDLPPGTGDVALTMAQKVPLTGAVVVSTPQNLALLDAKKAVDMFSRINVPLLGVIENMSSFTPPGSSEPIDLFPRGDLDQFLEMNSIKKLGVIPFQPSIGLSSEAGIPSMQGESDIEEMSGFKQAAEQLIANLK